MNQVNAVCSACGSNLILGRGKCDGCGLAIMASAIGASPQRRNPIMLALVFFFCMAAISIVAGKMLDHLEATRVQAAQQTHEAIVAREMMTTEGFQRRCGKADSIRPQAGANILIYDNVHMQVRLDGGPPVFLMNSADIDSSNAERWLNCKIN